jgi:hypothetical protein
LPMGLWHFGATALDRWVAKTVARYTSPIVERPAKLLTWAADEHVLGVMAGGIWLAARAGNERERRQTDHLVLRRPGDGHPASSVEAAHRPETAGPMHGPWAATGHTAFGEALRRFSVGPCHACRRGRLRPLLGLSKVGAGRLGSWRPHRCNTDRYSGALDDGRARRFGNGGDNRTMSAAAVRRLKKVAISAAELLRLRRKILPSSSNRNPGSTL